jgi:hypothetical protein
MATARRPFSGESSTELLAAIREKTPALPSVLNAAIPGP